MLREPIKRNRRVFLAPKWKNHGAATKNIARNYGAATKNIARSYDGVTKNKRARSLSRTRDHWATKLRRGAASRAGKRPRPRKRPNLGLSSKTDSETREKHRELKRKLSERADSPQSARQGGTEPGTTRFRDGRTTTRPPKLRRDCAAPAFQPRPRGPDLDSAQV